MPRKTMLLGLLPLMIVSLMNCQPAEPSPFVSSMSAVTGGSGASSSSAASSTVSKAVAPCAAPASAGRKITILAPCDGEKVAPRDFVSGTVADSNARVWVIIHPRDVADYWVQPNVTVREGGKWKVLCYFAEPGPQYSGKAFEVIAVANPAHNLKEGQMLADWPQAGSKSQVIEVVRE